MLRMSEAVSDKRLWVAAAGYWIRSSDYWGGFAHLHVGRRFAIDAVTSQPHTNDSKHPPAGTGGPSPRVLGRQLPPPPPPKGPPTNG